VLMGVRGADLAATRKKVSEEYETVFVYYLHTYIPLVRYSIYVYIYVYMYVHIQIRYIYIYIYVDSVDSRVCGGTRPYSWPIRYVRRRCYVRTVLLTLVSTSTRLIK
jgi:hypothetical protein